SMQHHARRQNVPLLEAARLLGETEELKARPRGALRELVAAFDRWRAEKDTEKSENQEAVSIMTLHSAKGLEFDTVFLPGWEEGLLPHQRSLDDQGRAGLEEERRLAHVGLTRARKRAKIYFTSHRRIHGMWNSTVPSRFLDELPEKSVEVTEAKGGWGQPASRFDRVEPFSSTYSTPGWQRGRAQKTESGFSDMSQRGFKHGQVTINGKAVERSAAPRMAFKP